jgi:hypothetical protein
MRAGRRQLPSAVGIAWRPCAQESATVPKSCATTWRESRANRGDDSRLHPGFGQADAAVRRRRCNSASIKTLGSTAPPLLPSFILPTVDLSAKAWPLARGLESLCEPPDKHRTSLSVGATAAPMPSFTSESTTRKQKREGHGGRHTASSPTFSTQSTTAPSPPSWDDVSDGGVGYAL